MACCGIIGPWVMGVEAVCQSPAPPLLCRQGLEARLPVPCMLRVRAWTEIEDGQMEKGSTATRHLNLAMARMKCNFGLQEHRVHPFCTACVLHTGERKIAKEESEEDDTQ